MRPEKLKQAKRLFGEVALPGDKSISHRAIMCGAIAKGETVAADILDCDDCNYTIRAFKDMGVRFDQDGRDTIIHGVGLNGLKRPAKPMNMGNSGTTMRIVAGILAGQSFESTLVGDEALAKRPMKRIIEPLKMMGVNIASSPEGFPPLKIKGGTVKPIYYKLPVPSAQVKSAVLFAGLHAFGQTTIEESVKSRDHTERMMRYFDADIKVAGLKVSVNGLKEMTGKELEVPGDVSGASFFAAGAILLKDSRVKINKVSVNPTRAGILNILSRMGAKLNVSNMADDFEPYGDIEVESGPLKGIRINENDIPGIIDELPIVFVLASLAKGKTVIRGAEELRVKETDRIVSMKENLEKMGGRISVEKDQIIIEGVKKLHGAAVKSYGDHRTCMSMVIAALTAEGESSIDDVECVNKSFPGFFKLLDIIRC